jgi:hypothetical protein
VKEECVNVGVVLHAEAGAGAEAWADVRFTRDWRRVRCLDPEADIELMEGMEREIKDRLAEGGEGERWLLERMRETFSNALRVSEPKALLAESPQEELGRLAAIYLERTRHAARPESGRAAIYAAMRGEFERQGVWALMRHNIAASQYTRRGDPLKIDCGYRPAGRVQLYHALSLETEANAAKALAFTYPQLRAGIERVEGVPATLTAVVENEPHLEDEMAEFAASALRESGVTVARLEEMPGIAASVRRQMGNPGN